MVFWNTFEMIQAILDIWNLILEIKSCLVEFEKKGSSILSKRKLESKLRKQTDFLMIFEN